MPLYFFNKLTVITYESYVGNRPMYYKYIQCSIKNNCSIPSVFTAFSFCKNWSHLEVHSRHKYVYSHFEWRRRIFSPWNLHSVHGFGQSIERIKGSESPRVFTLKISQVQSSLCTDLSRKKVTFDPELAGSFFDSPVLRVPYRVE